MNTPRCADEDYIQFLIASPRVVSTTKAARVYPRDSGACDTGVNPYKRTEGKVNFSQWR